MGLASGISSQLLHLQGRREHKISKSWQADGNLHLYRTDYLVTDHLAVAHSDSVLTWDFDHELSRCTYAGKLQ